ncbi:MAG: FG-GAP repeat protein [Proteobacteria bacterium]|nr:FG-GAP repeat protein [Pseudomonadota bacterium]
MDAIGHVVGLRGEVSAESADGLRALQLGGQIFPADVLLTSQGAHVEIRFNDQSVLSQGENARLTIDSFVYAPQDSAASNMILNMAEGTFRMVTGEIAASNPEGVSMVSPMATIGIRGTGADLQIGADGIKVGIFQYDGKDLTVTTPFGTMVINNANLILDVFADGSFGELRSYSDFEKAFFDAVAPILSIPVTREGGDDGDGGDGDGGDGDGEGDGGEGGGGEDEVGVELTPEGGATEGDIMSFIAGAMEEFLGDDTLQGGAGDDTLGGGDSLPGSGSGSNDPDDWGQPNDPFADSLAGGGDDDDDDTLAGGTTPAEGDDGHSDGGGSGGGDSTPSSECPALPDLDGTTGYTIQGDTAGVTYGADFAWVGDVNGDGKDDFIVSAANADPGGVTNAGEAYLIFGGSNLTTMDAADGTTDGNIDISYLDGSNGYVLQGYRTDGKMGVYGRNKNMSTVGDFNNDGYDDFSLGAIGFSTATGEGYVLFGGSALDDLDAMDGTADGTLNVTYLASGNGGDGSNGFILNGFTPYDQGGNSASYGDINGDGYSDVIQSAFMAGEPVDSDRGEVYVLFGGNGYSGGAEWSQNNVDGSNGVFFYNTNDREFMGSSVSGVPDMNGDGFGEVLIGANEGHGSNPFRIGKAYLVFGGANGVKGESSALSSGFNVAGLDGTNGYLLRGVNANDLTGQVTYADVNGDGISDLIIGAPHNYTGLAGPGRVFVAYGDQLAALDAEDGVTDGDISLINLLASNGADGTYGYVIEGNAGSTDRLGFSVQTAGDVNGDGYGDFMVGGYTAASNENGEAYLVFGGANGVNGWGAKQAELDPDLLGGEDGMILLGKTSGTSTGYSVGYLGDLNGDGYADFGVSGHGTGTNGEVYVVYGNEFTANADSTLLTLSGTAPSRTLTVRGQESSDELTVNLQTATESMDSGTANSVDVTDVTRVDATSYEGSVHFTGSTGDDTFSAGTGGSYVNALQGDDSLVGGSGADEFYGSLGSDTLSGGGGNDTLCGGEGADTVYSGSGSDTYLYMTAAGYDVDYLGDCDWAQDKLQLDSSGFGNLAVGTLDSGRFFTVSNYVGANVAQDGAVFIFDDVSDYLYYDDDGDDGVGSSTYLDLGNSADLDYSDIEIVSIA